MPANYRDQRVPYSERCLPEPMSGCWLWMGKVEPSGYGRAWSRESPRRPVMAHRAVYEELRGPVPMGLTLDHKCRVRSCVNPDHLEPCTMRVNTLRGRTLPAENSRRTACPQGHPYDLFYANGTRGCRACRRGVYARYRMRKKLSRLITPGAGE